MFASSLRAFNFRAFSLKHSSVHFERHNTSVRRAVIGASLSLAIMLATRFSLVQTAQGHLMDLCLKTLHTCEIPIETLITQIDQTLSHFRSQSTLLQEIAVLRQQNENLLKWQVQAQQLSQENSTLKSQANLVNEWPFDSLTVKVLGTQIHEHGRILLLSAGTQHRIKKNHIVITPEGLLGRVIDVGPQTCRVLRLDDTNNRIPVKIANQDAHAIVSGAAPNTMEVLRQAQQVNFQVGDMLVTSGEGGV